MFVAGDALASLVADFAAVDVAGLAFGGGVQEETAFAFVAVCLIAEDAALAKI